METTERVAPSDGPSTVDVVVIGAGVSGLATARGLTQRGVRVAVLEARDRVGGRLLSTGSLDLGATWFWPNETRIVRLVDELDIPVHSQYLAGDAMFHDPAGQHGPPGAQRLDGNPLDVQSGRFVEGADSVTTALARRLPAGAVHLGTIVESVAVDADRCHVVATDGAAWTCAHVVLALPPALATRSLSFTPSLPDDVAAVASNTPVWMGAISKVVVRYADAFWRRAGLSGSGISHVGPMREVHDMSGPDGDPAALFGFAPARAAGSPTATGDAVIAQLVDMFGSLAADPVDVAIVDWRHEPFTSPTDVEALDVQQAYGQTYGHPLFGMPTMHDRLHWASTETSREAPGHIEGALAAAERTVANISASTLPAAPLSSSG